MICSRVQTCLPLLRLLHVLLLLLLSDQREQSHKEISEYPLYYRTEVVLRLGVLNKLKVVVIVVIFLINRVNSLNFNK